MDKPANGFQLIFDAAALAALCQQNKKVVVTATLIEATTTDGKKVGAMSVYADAVATDGTASPTTSRVPGCPVPPCDNG